MYHLLLLDTTLTPGDPDAPYTRRWALDRAADTCAELDADDAGDVLTVTMDVLLRDTVATPHGDAVRVTGQELAALQAALRTAATSWRGWGVIGEFWAEGDRLLASLAARPRWGADPALVEVARPDVSVGGP